ncbi:unnamed protein product [Acanthoscelides obtectus]|uniref:Uncharacterized protein n=1 Tax=Acanthoscelides obtectus TaxID=200917 RepID=A0A9P0NZ33_ACAOB|nr:unnamed protein product [Acanthoscelides obtectus]CAK1647223.1 hypothetical protein AOBTE_LOCUS15120 [Acanthoscelides obtectus]
MFGLILITPYHTTINYGKETDECSAILMSMKAENYEQCLDEKIIDRYTTTSRSDTIGLRHSIVSRMA